jgi:hypothetical protein
MEPPEAAQLTMRRREAFQVLIARKPVDLVSKLLL